VGKLNHISVHVSLFHSHSPGGSPVFLLCNVCSGHRSSEKWDGGRTPREGFWGEGLPLSSCGVQGVTPGKFFENIGASLCNLVHFLITVQQKIYKSVFNLDFGKSI